MDAQRLEISPRFMRLAQSGERDALVVLGHVDVREGPVEFYDKDGNTVRAIISATFQRHHMGLTPEETERLGLLCLEEELPTFPKVTDGSDEILVLVSEAETERYINFGFTSCAIMAQTVAWAAGMPPGEARLSAPTKNLLPVTLVSYKFQASAR